MSPEELQKQPSITRDDIEAMFSEIGPPGENRDEKIAAMKTLNRKNSQGIDVSETAETYRGF